MPPVWHACEKRTVLPNYFFQAMLAFLQVLNEKILDGIKPRGVGVGEPRRYYHHEANRSDQPCMQIILCDEPPSVFPRIRAIIQISLCAHLRVGVRVEAGVAHNLHMPQSTCLLSRDICLFAVNHVTTPNSCCQVHSQYATWPQPRIFVDILGFLLDLNCLSICVFRSYQCSDL